MLAMRPYITTAIETRQTERDRIKPQNKKKAQKHRGSVT
jgi:hypothetical protein